MLARIHALVAGALLFWGMPVIGQDSFREPESRISVADWLLECYLSPDGTTEACQAYHRVLMNNATQIALVATFSLPSSGQGLLYQISVPLGIDLLSGVTMEVDTEYSVKLPVTRCTLQGCLMEGRLTDAPYDALMTGEAGKLVVRIPGQGALEVPMSLDGFSATIDRLVDAERTADDNSNAAGTGISTEALIELPLPGIKLGSDALQSGQNNNVDPALAPVTVLRK